MKPRAFIRRVRAKNYKSIAKCDVTLGPLVYLIEPNGSGKSNFLDVLHFVKDAPQHRALGTIGTATSQWRCSCNCGGTVVCSRPPSSSQVRVVWAARSMSDPEAE